MADKIKLGSRELRKTKPGEGDLMTIRRNPIFLILDRVTDTYNIGSLFRLADAVAAEKLFICGDVDYPPSSKIHKAAVGTEEWVPWEKRGEAVDVVRDLKEKGVRIISVEQFEKSIPLSSLSPDFPCAIVIGHETDGVSAQILAESDAVVELPMFGVNKSFNVWGSAAVVAYKLIELLIMKPYIRRKKS